MIVQHNIDAELLLTKPPHMHHPWHLIEALVELFHLLQECNPALNISPSSIQISCTRSKQYYTVTVGTEQHMFSFDNQHAETLGDFMQDSTTWKGERL